MKSLVATCDSNEALDDNTSSIASRRSSCIVDARILAHQVDELQPKGGSTMRRYAISFALVSLLLPVTVFSQTRTPDAAVNHFKNALKKSANGDFDSAIEDYTRAIRLSSHFDTSKTSDRFGNSFTDSNAVTVVDPFTANAYSNRGLARFRKGDIIGAIEDYTQALEIRPGLATAYLNRAAALRAKGDLDAAMKDLDKAISLKKDFFEAFTNRGSIRLDLKDTAGALSDLNRALELNTHVAEPYYQRGYVYMALKNFDSAVADFNRALQLSPDMAWAYHGRGTTAMFQGKMLDAINDFNRAIELNPTIALSWFNRGLAKVFLGDEAEAEKDFAESLRLKPELKAEMDRRIDLARHLRKIGNSK